MIMEEIVFLVTFRIIQYSEKKTVYEYGYDTFYQDLLNVYTVLTDTDTPDFRTYTVRTKPGYEL
jgi:hypothetical protein